MDTTCQTYVEIKLHQWLILILMCGIYTLEESHGINLKWCTWKWKYKENIPKLIIILKQIRINSIHEWLQLAIF